MKDEINAFDVLKEKEMVEFVILLDLREMFEKIYEKYDIELCGFDDLIYKRMGDLKREIGDRLLTNYWEEAKVHPDILRAIILETDKKHEQ